MCGEMHTKQLGGRERTSAQAGPSQPGAQEHSYLRWKRWDTCGDTGTISGGLDLMVRKACGDPGTRSLASDVRARREVDALGRR